MAVLAIILLVNLVLRYRNAFEASERKRTNREAAIQRLLEQCGTIISISLEDIAVRREFHIQTDQHWASEGSDFFTCTQFIMVTAPAVLNLKDLIEIDIGLLGGTASITVRATGGGYETKNFDLSHLRMAIEYAQEIAANIPLPLIQAK